MQTKQKKIILQALVQVLFMAVLCCAAMWQLQRSGGVSGIPREMAFRYLLLNLLTLAFLYLLVSIPWRKARVGSALFSGICTILAIANHYTLQFHGSILTVQELQNFGTAMDVIGQYHFFSPAVLPEVLVQLAVFAGCLILSVLEARFIEPAGRQPGRRRQLGCLLCAAAAGLILFSGKARPYLNKARSSWQPTVTIQYDGYPLTLLAALPKYELTPPEGYDPEVLAALPIPESAAEGNLQPDIILILNETFYDLAQVTELQTDESCLGGISSLSNTLLGNAIAQSGGGTNVTEFELLTSNPQSVVGSTPFNVLNLKDTASLVSILKAQGYYTMASHPAPGNNYNRTEGYAGLDFDEIHFGEDFQNTLSYGQRPFVTDESTYQNVIRWYENAASQEKPVFSYCLTLQNHGGWGQNPADADLVHVRNYAGSYPEEELNEYLSCIQLSDQAFVKLCSYFETVDRPVIVCMVGDHSPSFINAVTTRDLGTQAHIRQAAVPFVIWANYPLSNTGSIGDRSVTALGPMLLEQAGVAMSPFYRYILELNDSFPVITDWGDCITRQGTQLTFSQPTPETERIWNYLYLAHNNLLPDSLDAWFTVSH